MKKIPRTDYWKQPKYNKYIPHLRQLNYLRKIDNYIYLTIPIRFFDLSTLELETVKEEIRFEGTNKSLPTLRDQYYFYVYNQLMENPKLRKNIKEYLGNDIRWYWRYFRIRLKKDFTKLSRNNFSLRLFFNNINFITLDDKIPKRSPTNDDPLPQYKLLTKHCKVIYNNYPKVIKYLIDNFYDKENIYSYRILLSFKLGEILGLLPEE